MGEQFLVWDPAAVAGSVTSPARRSRSCCPTTGGTWKSSRETTGEKHFKGKLVGLLRDTLRLPMPAGSLRDGAYRDRVRGSLVPFVRFVAAGMKGAGVVTFGTLVSNGRGWKSTEGEMGKTQSSDGRDGRDGRNQLT